MTEQLHKTISWMTVFGTLGVVIFVTLLGYGMVFGFNNPTDAPPNNAGQVISIDSSGNVGIKTATPGADLEVEGKLRVGGGGSGWYSDFDSAVWKGQPSQTTSIYSRGNNSNEGLAFGNDNGGSIVTNMMILMGGNVGIGTVAPSYKLDVQGGQVNASGGLCIGGDCKTAWSEVGGSSPGGLITFWSGSPLICGTGNCSPTAFQIINSGIINGSPSSFRTLTIPTAKGVTGLVQQLPWSATVGDLFNFFVSINTGGYTITTQDSSVILKGYSTMNVSTGASARTFYCQVTSVAVNNESLTCY